MLRASILFLSILWPKRSRFLEALSSSRGLIVLLTYGGLTPPYGFSLKDNTSLFSTGQHRPLSIFHFLEMFWRKSTQRPPMSPSLPLTTLSPYGHPSAFFFYLKIPELLQQLLGTVAM